jgi:CubicO group peptidase (beta-lactamase class C family)
MGAVALPCNSASNRQETKMDLLPTARPEAVGLSTARLARIDAWMDALVASGKLPGVSVTLMRRGLVAYARCAGLADIARGVAYAPETMVRIYSMTKPITVAAILMLYEEGRFQLDDPITSFLPCFANQRVCVGGMRGKMDTVPAARDITFRDLMTHTSGLSYHFMHSTLVDAAYRDQGIDFQTSDDSLATLVERAAGIPLLSQPGEEWNYSIATDVLGLLVQVMSGQDFGEFVQQRVLDPLGMRDTHFVLPEEKIGRFAANYAPGKDGLVLLDDPATSRYRLPSKLRSGGGGLVSTAGDYLRFAQMLMGKGSFGGARLLGRKTVELMTSNHLRGDMAAMGQPRFSESTYEGVGFGLGVSVTLDPARAQIVGSPGEYAWGGAASTAWWNDPVEEISVVLLTQLTPSSTYPIRRELRALTYQAIVD